MLRMQHRQGGGKVRVGIRFRALMCMQYRVGLQHRDGQLCMAPMHALWPVICMQYRVGLEHCEVCERSERRIPSELDWDQRQSNCI